MLGFAYALAFAAVALYVLLSFVTGGKVWRHADTAQAAAGVFFLVVVLAVGAVVLTLGALLLLSTGQRGLLLAPLVCFLVFGSIGETADLLGTASTASNLFGLLLLALAALPCLLLIKRAGI